MKSRGGSSYSSIIFSFIFSKSLSASSYISLPFNSNPPGNFLVLDCHRALDPDTFTQVYNDYFVKLYLTALIKRQWGQNLIKFRGVKLPGGIELNGREIYDDAERELERIKEKMMLEYELPPLDFIG